MSARRFVAAVLAGVVAWGPASVCGVHAQEAPAPARPGGPVPPPAPGEAPLAPSDAPEVVAAYDRAFDLMVAGQYDAAAALFDDVAVRSVEPVRAAAARELARLARRMGGAAGGAVAGESAQEADDADARGASGGRAEVVFSSTAASFYTGFVLDDLFGVEDFRAQTTIIAATTGLGFAASLWLTRDRRIPGGMSEAYSVGLYSGLANGLLVGPLLGIDPEPDAPGDGDVSDIYLSFGLATMAVGGAAGLYLGHAHEPTRAQVRMSSLLGVSGAATAGLLLLMTQPEFDNGDIYPALIGLGLDAGLAAGLLLSPRLDWSSSRVTLVSLSELLGGLGGATVAALIVGEDTTDDEGRLISGLILGGLWGGFGLGTYFTRHMAPDPRFARPTGTAWTVLPTANGVSLAGAW